MLCKVQMDRVVGIALWSKLGGLGIRSTDMIATSCGGAHILFVDSDTGGP